MNTNKPNGMSHTPGPWEQGDGSDRNLFCGHGDIVGQVRPGSRGVIARVNPGLSDHEANARLIAAAPDMAEALKQAIETGHPCGCNAIKGPPDESWLVESDCDCWIKDARAALSRAGVLG